MQLNDTTQLPIFDLPPRALNVTGFRFDRLIALRPVGYTRAKTILWLCQCDCGNMTVTYLNKLRSGKTRSCGCLAREMTIQKNWKHGESHTPLFRHWYGIIRRCTDPRRKGYVDYGGRGIRICDEWRNSFEAFRDHVAQLPGYGEDGYTLDRVDNDGNYSPGNLRWATRTEQNRNKRNVRPLTYQGRTQCLGAWAEEIGVKQKVLENRLRIGWSIERTLSTPLDAKRSDRAKKAYNSPKPNPRGFKTTQAQTPWEGKETVKDGEFVLSRDVLRKD